MSSQDAIGSDRFAGRGDDFYAALLAAHDGLSDTQSAILNARLVLILANRIGDMAALTAALKAASKGLSSEPEVRT
ncbi:MAG: DUF2783 domain-containing protein [Pseudomonadota bacterium]